mgnify:FL=1
MRKIFIFFLFGVLGLFVFFEYESKHPMVFKEDVGICEGDIVFQTSNSKQSPFIQHATGSKWTHCGIVVYKGDKPYVFEASNVVKLTPFNEWKARSSNFTKERLIDNCPKIKYKKYLGKPYDTSFRLDNDKYYCSELVYDIYKNQLGVEFKLRKVSSYNILGLNEMLKNRGIKLNQLVIAPSDLL